MIIIRAEDGTIIMDPKEIYINKDLEGHLHIYADMSTTDRMKAVELTVFEYSKEVLGLMLETLYKKMNDWLFMHECPHYVIRMEEVRDMATQNSMEASDD